jgi:Zn finger protein HypA/HybF involved in hydrogenase expression
MGYKNENIKHRQGVGSKPKFSCPKCNNPLSINKPMFMVACPKCKKIITEDEL